jgi:hypothetical protein
MGSGCARHGALQILSGDRDRFKRQTRRNAGSGRTARAIVTSGTKNRLN